MIPSGSVGHPTYSAICAAVFILGGVIWEPYLAAVALFFLVMLWHECVKWVNLAKGIEDQNDREETIQATVRKAVESGRARETIEELREMMGKIPGGRFTKKARDLKRYQDMDSTIDRLLTYTQ